MTFWCAGYRNVTAAYGVEGFGADHLAAFARHEVRRVLIAFDRDEAGERGSAKVAEKLREAGIECGRIEFPRGMDANEYALKVTPAVKSLGVLIRKAAWLGHGKPSEREPASATEAPAETPPSSLAAKENEAAAPALPPSPPPAAPADIAAETTDSETVLSFGDRRWRVRGLARNLSYDVLKVNLLAARGEVFHVDTLDLYNARARAGFLAQAAAELRLAEEVLKADLGRVLVKLEALQEVAIRDALRRRGPGRAVPGGSWRADAGQAAVEHRPQSDRGSQAGALPRGTSERRLPPVPPRLRHAHAGERRRYPGHPGAARPRQPLDDASLYAGLHPAPQGGPRTDAPGPARPRARPSLTRPPPRRARAVPPPEIPAQTLPSSLSR